MWASSFEDSAGDISDFFEHFGDRITSVVAETELTGGICAAGHIVPAGRLVSPNSTGAPCAMLYAVAARPDLRGRGYGAAVTRALALRARELGFSAVVLRPASDGLFEYYSGRAGFRDYFYASERVFRASDAARAPKARARPVTSAQYRSLRERLLGGVTHIEMDGAAVAYQELLCARSGGGLFAIRIGGAADDACAAVELEPGGRPAAKEFLTGAADAKLCAASLASVFGAAEITARSPAQKRSPALRFGMIYGPGGAASEVAPAGWYGPAFD
jgi:GNAT superfamily N-acetyltransferase